MSFVSESKEEREEPLDCIQENIQNYMVRPFADHADDKDYPLTTLPASDTGLSGWSMLKDSESHQVVETLLGATLVSLVGEQGFIQTRRRGMENTFKASTTSRLLEYDLEIPGEYRTLYQWLKDGFVIGTGIVFDGWDYREEPVIERVFTRFGNQVTSEFVRGFKEFEDPSLENIDLLDFFPACGQWRMDRMSGCAVRFTMTAREALVEGERLGWDMPAVRRAIDAGGKTDTHQDEDWARLEGIDRTSKKHRHPDFIPLVGYTYWGEVPWKVPDGENHWRKLVVLGGETVGGVGKEGDWPFMRNRLPFYDFTVNPMSRRFYGLSPLEVARHAQDLADVILNCLSDAVVKSTHPPWLVDRDARINKAKLRDFHPNVPIETDRMDGVKQLDYAPPLQLASGMLAQTKLSIQQRTGTPELLQSGSFSSGVPRSASAAAIQDQRSNLRPEMIAQMIERDTFVQLGLSKLRLNQQFLEDDDALMERIGSMPRPSFIEEIMDEQDVKFVGSRSQHNKQTRVEAMERAGAVIGQLPVAPLFPWQEFMVRYLRDLDLHELEQMVADPKMTQIYSLISQLSRGGGAAQAQNGVATSQAPAGLLPAQTAGRVAR